MNKWIQLALTLITIAALGVAVYATYQVGNLKSDIHALQSDINTLESDLASQKATMAAVEYNVLQKPWSDLVTAEFAIAGCLFDAGVSLFDHPAKSWDGSPGKLTRTVGGHVYDAADYLHHPLEATYDVSQDGTITEGHDAPWFGVVWGSRGGTMSWVLGV